MNTVIEVLNAWGDQLLHVAWPLLWQSSLLIGIFFGVERLLRHRVRAAVRYALWLVVLLKLVLPPSLALPTGLGWWLHSAAPKPRPSSRIVEVSEAAASQAPMAEGNERWVATTPRAMLSGSALVLMGAAGGSFVLALVMFARWRQVRREINTAAPVPEAVACRLEEARRAGGMRQPVRLQLLEQPISPAVCGLWQPVVLLPRSLIERLSPAQLRSVLLHELVHVRRLDVWANCAQALLQVVYWWHPLLWMANARIRRVREEAVDDAVMLALREESDSYAPTLVEVARLALQRPLASLGLVGILESHGFLRQRIERLLDFHPPRRAGLSLASVLCVAAFGALALPMGEGPAQPGTNLNLVYPAQHLQMSPTNNRILTSRSRLWIYEQLTQRRLALVDWNGLALQEVVRRLNQAAAAVATNDPALRFSISSPEPAQAEASINGVPASGNAASATNGADVRWVPIRFKGVLKDAKLADVLEAVCSGAEQPIQYTVDDFGIIFSARLRNGTGPLFTRVFHRVDMDALLDTHSFDAGASTNSARTVEPGSKTVRECFARWGVELAAPEAVFLNRTNGDILVRATLAHLDVIEAKLSGIPSTEAQLNIRSTFVAVPEPAAASFWRGVGVTNMSATNPSVVLSYDEAQKILKSMQSIAGGDQLNEASVTTLSGRQTEIQMIDQQTVLTGLNPLALRSPGVTDANVLLITNSWLGPVLDVVPRVLPDRESIQLLALPTIVEFLGYDKPTNAVTVYVAGKPRKMMPPLPRFHSSSCTNLSTILDGQTLVLGGLVSESIVKVKDKVPVLGDVPLLGQLFRSESSSRNKRQVLVFITPTMVDAAGNPIHRVPLKATAGARL